MLILKKISFLLFFLFFIVGNLFARETTFWSGYAVGKEIKNAWIIGVDMLSYDANKNIALGARVYTLVADRKQYEIGNGNCRYDTILLGGMYHTNISKNIEFDTKFFTGLGWYYRTGRVERQKKKEEYLTAYLLGCDLSVGARYNFTRKFGLGLGLGYRHCFDTRHKTDDKFDLSGFQATLNFCVKLH